MCQGCPTTEAQGTLIPDPELGQDHRAPSCILEREMSAGACPHPLPGTNRHSRPTETLPYPGRPCHLDRGKCSHQLQPAALNLLKAGACHHSSLSLMYLLVNVCFSWPGGALTQNQTLLQTQFLTQTEEVIVTGKETGSERQSHLLKVSQQKMVEHRLFYFQRFQKCHQAASLRPLHSLLAPTCSTSLLQPPLPP